MQRLPARRVTRWMYFAAVIATAPTASSAQEQTTGQGFLPFRLQGGRFSMGGMTVGSLITLGYGIQRFQLVGGPAWLNTDRFDINAISEDVPLQPTPPGTPNRMQLLVRSLL